MASTIDTIMQVGKGGIPDTLIAQVKDALRARELIKLKCLDNSEYGAKEAAAEIALKAGCETVAVIGSKMIFYKLNPNDRKIFFSGEKRPVEKKKRVTGTKKVTVKAGGSYDKRKGRDRSEGWHEAAEKPERKGAGTPRRSSGAAPSRSREVYGKPSPRGRSWSNNGKPRTSRNSK